MITHETLLKILQKQAAMLLESKLCDRDIAAVLAVPMMLLLQADFGLTGERLDNSSDEFTEWVLSILGENGSSDDPSVRALIYGQICAEKYMEIAAVRSNSGRGAKLKAVPTPVN